MLARIEDQLRTNSSQYLFLLETMLYLGVGVLLGAAAVGAVFQAGSILWRGITSGTTPNYGLAVLDQLLLVLMLVEILHTVRISIRSQTLVMEPFLIVGLIASIRRVLVITMQAAQMAEQGQGAGTNPALSFRDSMIELALLGFLIIVFVVSIYLLRRASGREELATS